MEQLDPALTDSQRTIAQAAVDHALYGLMRVIDGVTGALRSEEWTVNIRTIVRLHHRQTVVEQLDLFDGDGACMGYHRWLKGDFGIDPIVVS
jgi:hypothetical protein